MIAFARSRKLDLKERLPEVRIIVRGYTLRLNTWKYGG